MNKKSNFKDKKLFMPDKFIFFLIRQYCLHFVVASRVDENGRVILQPRNQVFNNMHIKESHFKEVR